MTGNQRWSWTASCTAITWPPSRSSNQLEAHHWLAQTATAHRVQPLTPSSIPTLALPVASQGAPGGLVGALEHLELAPRGGGGPAPLAPGAPDLLAELENIRTPPVPGAPHHAAQSGRISCVVSDEDDV